MEPARLKCNVCKRVKFEIDFIKNKKVLKSCITCREKNKNEKTDTKTNEKKIDTVIVTAQLIEPLVTIEKMEQLSLTTLENKIEQVENSVSGKWYTLSGRWIKQGDELKLHKMLTKKLNRQFMKQSAFHVHKYLTRYLMVDIRDI
jgi:hypothetical protein